MLLVVLISSVALQVWAWQRLSHRVRDGAVSRFGAVMRYSLWAFLPCLLLVGAFLAAVGLEEWLDVAIIEESPARAAPLLGLVLIAVSTLGTLSFAIRCALGIRRRPPD